MLLRLLCAAAVCSVSSFLPAPALARGPPAAGSRARSPRAPRAAPERGREDGARIGTVNERMMRELQKTAAPIRRAPTEVESKIQYEAVDLNGVQPLVLFASAVAVALVSAGAWIFTNVMAVQFTENPLETDIYFLQRISSFIRQVVVGTGALGTGIFGVTALGLGALGVRVTMGVVSGELDPSLPQIPSRGPGSGATRDRATGAVEEEVAGEAGDAGAANDSTTA